MKNIIAIVSLTVALAGCATPMTVLKHPKTGQVATCGGGMAGSAAGGAIGYHIEKDKDLKCVEVYKSEGFKVVRQEEGQ